MSNEAKKLTAWTQTFTGKQFTPYAPQADQIEIEDIAHSLALQCRFNGHIKRFYSVAEHSVYVSYLVSPVARLKALLHDAPEAWIGDMVAPLKWTFPEFHVLEDTLMSAVEQKFDVPVSAAINEEVHTADQWIVHQEAKALFPARNHGLLKLWKPCPDFKPPFHIDFGELGRDPVTAKAMFLSRFNELVREHKAVSAA